MHSLIDFSITITGLTFLWLIWDLGIKKTLLASFREKLLRLRFSLFKLGMDGHLPFDSAAYRAIERLLCGLLRYAHHVTFLSYKIYYQDLARHHGKLEFGDVASDFKEAIASAPEEVRQPLRDILENVDKVLVFYMCYSSVLFMCSAFVLFVSRGGWQALKRSKERDAKVIKVEAYRLEALPPILVTG